VKHCVEWSECVFVTIISWLLQSHYVAIMHNTAGPSTAEFVWELCNAVIGPKTGRLLVYTMLKFGELAFFVCTRDISVCMRDEKTNMRR